MQNNVEYILEIKDLMFKKLEVINSSIAKMEGNIAGISKQTSMAGNSLMSFGSIVAAAFSIDKVMDFGREVIRAGTTVEDATTGLTVTLKSAAAAAAVVNQVMKDAEQTPFAFEALLAGNQALISTGLSAGKAREDVLALGNAVSLAGKGNVEFERMVGNLQQIRNAGKATSVDIKQFAIAGINIYGILAKTTGISTEKLKEMDISYDVLTKSLREYQKENDGFAAMAGNTSVQISNLGDAMFRLANDIFKDMKPAIDGVVAALRGMVNWISANRELLYSLAEAVSIAGVAYAAWRTSLFLTTGVLKGLTIWEGIQFTAMLGLEAITNAVTAAQVALNVAWAANPVGLVIAGIVVLVGVIKMLYDRFEVVRGAVWGLWGAFKGAFGAIVELVKTSAMAMIDILKGIVTFDTDLIMKGVKTLGTNIATQYYQIGKGAVEGFQSGYKDGVADFKNEKDAEMYATGMIGGGVGAGYGEDSKFSAAGLGMQPKGGGKGSGGKDKSLKEAVGTVAGTSNKYVNITIQKLVGIESLVTNNMKESKDMIKRYALQALTEAVTDANAVAGR